VSTKNVDVTAGTDTTDTPPEGTEENKPGTESTDANDEGSKPDEDADEDDEDGESDLPDWAKAKLSKANKEAGKYRTQLRELQTRLEGAKTPEEVAAITGELTETNTTLARELAVERALRKHHLSDDDAVFLTAGTAEEIAKQAEALASRIGTTEPMRLRGGLDPTDDDNDSDDPGELAKKYGRRRY